MKRFFLTFLVFYFFGSQISFVLAFDQEPDTNIVDLVGGRIADEDNEGGKEPKKQKKKGKKGKKNPKSHGVIPLDDNVLLELDRTNLEREDEGDDED